MESYYKMEILSLQHKLEDLYSDQRELIYKYECNEKFWSMKTQKLEEELIRMTTEERSWRSKQQQEEFEKETMLAELDETKKARASKAKRLLKIK